MSASMQLTFGLIVTESDVDTEHIQPEPLTLAISGDSFRRTLTLADGVEQTLDIGEITPKWWYFQNIHATQDLIISFGQSDDITLSAGEFSFLRSGLTPIAKGSGGASKLLYACYA